MQRLLDAFEVSPALIKTATWDVVAWNRAAAVVLTDYGAPPPNVRNILRLILCDPEFERLWRDNNVHVHGEGAKRLRQPILGPIMMEYFAVDGRPDLGMIVYNPATASDAVPRRVAADRSVNCRPPITNRLSARPRHRL